MKNSIFYTLRSRLFLILLLSLLPALGLLLYSGLDQRRQKGIQAQERALGLARSISRNHEKLINDARQILFTLAQIPAVESQDAAACSRIFANLLSHSELYSGFAAAREDGEVFASAPARKEPVNFSDRAWFQNLKKNRSFTIGEAQIGRISGKPTLTAAYPVFDKAGRIATVLAAGLDLHWLEKFVDESDLPEGTAFIVFDRNGVVLISYPADHERFIGTSMTDTPLFQLISSRREGVVESPWLDGRYRLFGFTTFGPTANDLFVSVGILARTAFAEARSTIIQYLVALAMIVVLAFLALWFGGNALIIRPVHRLLSVTKQLANGDLGARTGPPYAAGAIGQLAQAFDQMAESLKLREQAREEAEAKRRQLEGRYQLLFDSMVEGFALHEILCDAQGDPVNYRFIEANASFEKLTGLKREEIIGKTALEVLPNLEPYWIKTYGEVALTGKPVEFVNYTRELDRYYRVISFSPQKGWFAAVFTDVTDEKKKEEQLSQQLHWTMVLNSVSRAISERNTLESVLRVVMKHLEDSFPFEFCGIALYNGDNKTACIRIVSSKGRALASSLGMAEGVILPAEPDVVSRYLKNDQASVLDLEGIDYAVMPAPHSILAEKMQQAGLHSVALIPLTVEGKPFGLIFMAFKSRASFSAYEMSFLSGLSGQLSIAAHNRGIYEELETAYIDLKRTQVAMMEQERLNAMGQMASGIAHDINNMLAPITLYTEALLEHEPNLSEKAKRFLKTMQAATQDIENTTMRLRLFYRKPEDESTMQPVDLSQLVTQVIDLSRPRWEDMPRRKGFHIAIKTDLGKTIPLIMGIESEIREALVNIVFNAVDAMPEGGTLTIATGLREPNGIVEVTDTGMGMDEEQKQRCLEPFYTTKGEHGTGLGLSTAYGVMKRHGGDIAIESELSKGTMVRLLFPVTNLQAPGAVRREAPLAFAALRILCVDDDAVVGESLKEILQMDGHAVNVVNSGEEGIKAFRSAKEGGTPFDVVITDLGMPHMSGKEVAREVKRESPTTPVILLSGWGSFMNMNGEKLENVDLVLGKPPKVAELRSAIRKLGER